MGWKLQLFLVGSAILVGMYLAGFFSSPPPSLEPGEGWWAKEDPKTAKNDTSIREFKITFSEKEQQDLKRRLQNTRYFESLEGTNWEYGARADEMKKIVDYWLNKYSWAKQEKVFNQFNHFKTNIEGIDIHFVHVKPKVKPGQKVKTILMVHGWPGSFYEFYKIIPMLTDPLNHGGTEDDVFEVICPSLPGYGFSEAAHKPGLGPIQIARIFNTLMHERLGFESYYVQGGDWGSVVVEMMSLFFPQNIRGFHSNFIRVSPPLYPLRLVAGYFFPNWFFPRAGDRRWFYPIWDRLVVILRESGFYHIQATKPDTIGHGLTDSPVGLAAYILEKFASGTDLDAVNHQDGKLTENFDLDDLLNNVMVYWIPGAMATAVRLYKENVPLLFGSPSYRRFVRGHHSNFIMVFPPWLGLRLMVAHFFPEWSFPEETSRNWFTPLGERVSLYLRETGYWHIQATKPDTLGLALTDSPAGLAAYILDKFPFSTNPDYINYQDGKLTERFEMDDLLNNIMTYWIPGSFVSCMRSYKELLSTMPNTMKYGQLLISVPTGYAVFPNEALGSPRHWLKYRYANVVSYTLMPDGGHYAALEQPKLLVEDVRRFSKATEEFWEARTKEEGT